MGPKKLDLTVALDTIKSEGSAERHAERDEINEQIELPELQFLAGNAPLVRFNHAAKYNFGGAASMQL